MTGKKAGGDRTAFQPRDQSITGGGVMISQDRPWRKQPPEFVMDLARIPRRKVSDALREAVQANQSKRSKNSPKIVARRRARLLCFNKPATILK